MPCVPPSGAPSLHLPRSGTPGPQPCLLLHRPGCPGDLQTSGREQLENLRDPDTLLAGRRGRVPTPPAAKCPPPTRPGGSSFQWFGWAEGLSHTQSRRWGPGHTALPRQGRPRGPALPSRLTRRAVPCARHQGHLTPRERTHEFRRILLNFKTTKFIELSAGFDLSHSDSVSTHRSSVCSHGVNDAHFWGRDLRPVGTEPPGPALQFRGPRPRFGNCPASCFNKHSCRSLASSAHR